MEDNFIMKLTQLEYFCVAARYHNITKAAKELFLTQPTISAHISSLEKEFPMRSALWRKNLASIFFSAIITN